MLDVHPAPHAAHGVKDFLVHILTIVVGLLIAVGLEQLVEHFHHSRELSEVREELRNEREANRKAFTRNTNDWRWETVQLQNNLMVLAFLQKHPGTPDEQLPGALVWSHGSEPHREAGWEAARTSGVTSLMPREEIEQYEDAYNKLKQIDEARVSAWNAMADASRYQFTSSRLSQLSPAQINEITGLTEIAFSKHWLEGVALENMAEKYRDFPASLSPDELSRAHNRKSFSDSMEDPAFAATISRMRAAGFGR